MKPMFGHDGSAPVARVLAGFVGDEDREMSGTERERAALPPCDRGSPSGIKEGVKGTPSVTAR